MALSSVHLLEWIAQSRYLIKNYAAKLEKFYRYGILCPTEETNMITAVWYLNEIELYYDNCSCLIESDICDMIVEIQTLTQ